MSECENIEQDDAIAWARDSEDGTTFDGEPAVSAGGEDMSVVRAGCVGDAAPITPVGRMNGATTTPATLPVELAVFDFDGTSINGNSPVLLVLELARRNMLKNSAMLRILLWAAAYKCRLPQNESWVRSLVFSAFEGMPVAEVDQFMSDFYDQTIAPCFRAQADAAMRKHAEEGRVVLVVSATFEPIILRAMEHHPFKNQISTRMRVAPDGTYTREVEGRPVEGDEKLVAVRHFGDKNFGEGNWKLAYAYGDHHSDRAVLSAAEHAFAVDPDTTLARTARKCGWEILDWD